MVKTLGSKILTILKMESSKVLLQIQKLKKPKREQLHWLRRAAACHKGDHQSYFRTVITGEPDELNREDDWRALMSLIVQEHAGSLVITSQSASYCSS